MECSSDFEPWNNLNQPEPRREVPWYDAEKRFKALTEAGFIAAERTGTGESRQVKSFNPNAEETLFFPRLVGG